MGRWRGTPSSRSGASLSREGWTCPSLPRLPVLRDFLPLTGLAWRKWIMFTVNGKEVFNMTQPQITAEIVQSPLKMVLQVERGTFIVPSFDEIRPQAGKESSKDARRKRMGMDYILEAMQHHGLGHLPQPDNFTTCGRLGIEVNQYNNPIECYADETIDDMREEKVIVDHPEMADKLLKGNTQKHKEQQMNPIAAQKLKSANFDPKRSAVMMAINAQ